MKLKNAKYFLAYIALLGLASSPIWFTSRPQLGDYTNHLARVHILLNVPSSPALQQFYASQWDLIPNLAMDLVVKGFASLMSLEIAGKTFITLTLLLLSSGTIALHAAVHKRLAVWPLVVFLILYNLVFLLGSLGFLFGLGMAMWMLAAWIFLRHYPTWLRTLIFSLLAVALYFAHLSAFGVYLLALLGYEFAHNRDKRAESFLVAWPAWVPTLIQLITPSLLFLLSPTAGGYEQFEYNFINKIARLFYMVGNYNLLLDGMTFILFAEVVVLGLVTKRLTIDNTMRYALWAVAISYLLMPSVFFSGDLADTRILIGLSLLFVASTDMRLHSAAETKVVVISLLGIFMLRMAFINDHWQSANHLQDEYIKAFDKLPQGAKLLTLNGDHDNWYDKVTMLNLSCWAVIKKSAFVPTLYAYPTQQPISFTPPYRTLANAARSFQDIKAPLPNIFNDYDYVLIERNHPAFTFPSQPNLRLIERNENFRLFKTVLHQGDTLILGRE